MSDFLSSDRGLVIAPPMAEIVPTIVDCVTQRNRRRTDGAAAAGNGSCCAPSTRGGAATEGLEVTVPGEQ